MIVTLLGSCIRFNYISSDFACHAVLSSSSSFLPCYYRIEFLVIVNVEFSRSVFCFFFVNF
jgi:hypothetical protein